MIAWILGACERPPEGGLERGPQEPPLGELSLQGTLRWPLSSPGRSAPAFPDALREVCAGSKPAIDAPGQALSRVTLYDAVARCNDGSPPVLYVRAAQDPAHARDWVVHLEGGASCDSFESCAERWCGTGPTYDASNMSSLWAQPSRKAAGLFGLDTRNRFRGWNVAQLSYCSSDFWLGTEPAAVLVSSAPPGDPTADLAFTIPFQGDGILDAALDALAAGVTSDDGQQTLPELSLAQTLVFGGSSAGGHGAVLQLNDVVQRFPEAKVIGLLDSVASPSPALLSDQGALQLTSAVQTAWETRGTTWGAVLDIPCERATSASERWRCFELDHVLRQFVSVPIAIHYDLFDSVIGPFYYDAGLSEQELLEVNLGTLLEYAKDSEMSVQATGCGVHMSVTRNTTFLDMEVDGLSMEETLAALVEGEVVSAIDARYGRASHCP